MSGSVCRVLNLMTSYNITAAVADWVRALGWVGGGGLGLMQSGSQVNEVGAGGKGGVQVKG
jgi:hypothetical protein